MGQIKSLESLKKMEEYLFSRLKPIKPNPSFIQQLQAQFSNAKSILMEKKSQTVTFFIIVFGVVMSAIVLLLLGKPKTKKQAEA